MSTPDFFRSRLGQMIDLRHALAVLATRLPWGSIETAVASKLAHQARPAKRVAGVDLAAQVHHPIADFPRFRAQEAQC
jgi:IS5 family transposase